MVFEYLLLGLSKNIEEVSIAPKETHSCNMGLFQKNKPAEKSKDELHEYVDNLLQDSTAISNEEIDEKFSVEAMSLNTKYGINHVVALMRDLPADASDVVVSTVTKTLESAGIDVLKIIEDASSKEAALTAQIEDLNGEIDELKQQIANKKEQISVSSAVLEETQRVRTLLESTRKENNKSGKNANVSSISDAQTSTNAVTEDEAVKMALEAQ